MTTVIRLGADAESSSVSILKSLGCQFISRYLSDYPSKNLTLSEATNLSNAGIWIVSNWEDDVNTWQGGYARGLRDATVAWGQHKACGGPDKVPIYFSIDEDVNANDATLHAYFQGLGAGMTPGQIGVYGSTSVCNGLKAAGLVAWTWRTMSTGWTGGVGDPSMFNVEQTGYFNSSYDRDASITDNFGQWQVGKAYSATPAPPVTQPSKPNVSLAIVQMCANEDPSKAQGQTTNYLQVLPVQNALVALKFLNNADNSWGRGAWGWGTIGAYSKFQMSLGYKGVDADGHPGNASLTALANKSGLFTVSA